jgi:glycerate 2-kinase
MNILIAPDKFKDCLSSEQVAHHIAEGVRTVLADAHIDECPLADGGEGTVSALISATNGTLHSRRVTGPIPDTQVDATFGFLGNCKTAVVEMSQASGLFLVPRADRNPMNTTTYGTGQLLVAAAEMGATEIIVGIGGSATCDAGIGCCQAAGLSVLRKDGETVSHNDPLCGRDLADIALIKRGRGSRLDRIAIRVACDVDNPLLGPRGAAAVFGPQKGARPEDISWFDANMESLARRSNAIDAALHPGAGAAGGLGFALLAFFNAQLVPGFDLIADAVKLRQRLQGVDLVLTAEGCLDQSSLAGKTPVGVARLCREMNIPCIALPGRIDIDQDLIRSAGFTEAVAVTPVGMSMREAVERCPEFLRDAAARVCRVRFSGT